MTAPRTCPPRCPATSRACRTGWPPKRTDRGRTHAVRPPRSPDADAFLGGEPHAVAVLHAERGVELVDVLHHRVAAELRRRVRVDRQPPRRLLRARLGGPRVRPG